MDREFEDAGLVIECKLDAVAVVGVDIEVEDTTALLEEILDRDDDIIDVAESGCVVAAGMVESPGRAEDEIDVRL